MPSAKRLTCSMAAKTLSATERAKRSRAATQAVTARELLYAGILSRLWPSYITKPTKPGQNPTFTFLLCVETPVGLIVWRLSEDEAIFFDWIEERPNDGRKAEDKQHTLHTLASNGWA